ncbi:MAG: hypothetical protein Q4C72_09075 [Eubacteriales bacterium]|nr:hypothetical protein [Eubacteriales bacterium]
MRKRHILGFFDSLVRTPAFLFLCAMFLCGAVAGGLTGLHAGEGDNAVRLTAMLSALPAQAAKSVLCAVLWVALPLLCALLRPAALFLSALTAARGFVLALTVAVGIGQAGSFGLSLCATGVPAVLSVPALLAACAMVWQSGEATGRYSLRGCRAPYVLCLTLAAASAMVRVGFAVLWNL